MSLLITLEDYRRAQSEAHKAWWDASTEVYKAGRWETVDDGKYKKHISVCDDPALVAKEAELKVALERIEAEAVAKFAKPEVADCDYCKRASVFGGPGHYASPRCRSGQKPHCTCDTCF